MAYKMSFRRGINIGRVVSKIATTVLVLYVGGTILTEIGDVINGTSSAFYEGLTLIGWSVGSGTAGGCGSAGATQVCNTSGSGILAVVGIIGIASVVLEFVHFRMG